MSKPIYVSDGIRWKATGASASQGRDPYLQPFRSDSIWNLPIAILNSQDYASDTDSATADLIDPSVSVYANASPSEFTHPVYRAQQGDPWALVHDETNQVGGFQAGGKWGFKAPVNAFPDEGTDSTMGVISADSRYAYEWHGMVKTGPSEYRSWRQPTEAFFTSGNSVLYDLNTVSVTFNLSVDNVGTMLVSRTGHELEDQAPVVFGQPTSGGGSLPPEVIAGQTYYVRYLGAKYFEISTTPGGPRIEFTADGSGRFAMGNGTRMVVQKMYEGSDVLAFRNSLGGFVRAQSYYVVNAQIQGGLIVFSLSSTEGGAAITPTASGYIRLIPIDDRKQTKGRVVRVDLYGKGLGPDGGSRAFEGSVHGGLIRKWEIEVGEIKHALAMACGKSQMRYDSGSAGYVLTSVDFSADAGTGVLTLINHGFDEGDSVYVLSAPTSSGVTVPGTYYAVNVTSNTLQLAAIEGGTAVAIGASGTVTARDPRYGYGEELGYVWPATSQDSGSADAYGTTVTLTATSGSATLTLNNHGYTENDPVRVQAVPDGSSVSISTTYFARNVDVNTLQLAASVGGSAITMTATGNISARRFGNVRMGQYFAIPWSVNVETLNLTDAGKILARAFQRYGGYVTDTAQETFVMCFIEKRPGVFDENDPTIAFRNQLKAGTANNNTWSDLDVIRAELRRVLTNTKATPNGGAVGAPRRAPLAEDLQP